MLKKQTLKIRRVNLRCEVCGAVLVNTSTGSACSDNFGHGYLMPKRNELHLEYERCIDWASTLVEAIPYISTNDIGGRCIRYRISGRGGYQRVRRIKRIPVHFDGVYAKVNGAAFVFVSEAS
jgi:hypothetical protein